jgi:high mobility group protein B1
MIYFFASNFAFSAAYLALSLSDLAWYAALTPALALAHLAPTSLATSPMLAEGLAATTFERSSPEKMKKYKAAKAKAAGPKRALSAFFIFSGDERSKVVAANPSASIGEVAKEVGARWAKASAGVKAAYQAKSDKDKARYAAEKAKFDAKK